MIVSLTACINWCLKTPLYSVIVYNNNRGPSSLLFFLDKGFFFFFCIPGHLVIVGEEVFVFAVVHSLSCVRLFGSVDCSTRGSPVLHCLLEFAHIHVHWVADTIQPSQPLLPLLLVPSTFPSIRIFSNELALHIKWPKYWSFSFSIGPSTEYSGLISFRIDWLDLLAVQGVVAVRSRNKLTQKVNADSGVQFITPAGPRQSLLLAKDPDQFLWKPYIP